MRSLDLSTLKLLAVASYRRVKRFFAAVWHHHPTEQLPVEQPIRTESTKNVERATDIESIKDAASSESISITCHERAPESTDVERPENARAGRKGEKHDFSYHHLRRDLSEELRYVLEHFENLNPRRAEFAAGDMAILEELWGGDFLLLDRGIGDRMIGGGKWDVIDGIPTSETADAVWPLDHAFATVRQDHIELMRFATVTSKELRGLPMKMVRPKMIRVLGGILYDSGTWRCYENIFGLVGEDWRMLTTPDRYDLANLDNADMKSWDKRIKDHLPSIFRYEYDWHVAFGSIYNGPRVITPINPVQALKLFKNREAAADKTRRAALKHWVEEHWREDEEGLAYICHHLRGHTRFRWSDLNCELFVSAYDLRKNDFFKKQASEWRAKRKHNRVKVHLKKKTTEEAPIQPRSR